MTRYAKYISDTQIEFAPKNKGAMLNYDTNIEAMTKDGYKPFVPAVPPEPEIRMYHFEYRDSENTVDEIIVYDETQEEAQERLLNTAKELKIGENDTKRDAALNQGVVYEYVLFDSDTDQKVNLLATVEMLPEGATIEWFGMDNQPLLCTKEDLYNIGGLITQLHSFCWNKNAQIKQAINNALTIADVENITIDYEE